MLAPDGRCKTLDAAGDGYVRAENCIVLLLEALLEDMIASAIVQGSAVKQVGRNMSLCLTPSHSIQEMG